MSSCSPPSRRQGTDWWQSRALWLTQDASASLVLSSVAHELNDFVSQHHEWWDLISKIDIITVISACTMLALLCCL